MEILLVLCCTVGIVAFMCFSISTINLGFMHEKEDVQQFVESPSSHVELQNKQTDRINYLKQLRDRIDDYRRQITKKEKLLARVEAPEKNRRKLEQYSRELNELEAKITQKESELASYSTRSADIDKTQKKSVAELDNLKRRLREVEEEMNHEYQQLQEMANSPESALEAAIDSLSRLAALEDDSIGKLETDISAKKSNTGTIDIRTIMKGRTRFTNPLFAECRSGQVLLFPVGATLGEDILSSGNPFSSYKSVYDGIVFFVRPNGFDTFNIAFSKAQEKNFRIAYEPVDADWHLDYGKTGM